MEVIQYVTMLGLLARCVVTDVRDRKIENQLIMIGSILGLLLLVLSRNKEMMIDGMKWAVIVFLFLFVGYLMKGIGGGDVKLLSIMALFISNHVVDVIFGSFILSGVFILSRMIFRWIRKRKVYKPGESICMSIPITLSYLIYGCSAYLM